MAEAIGSALLSLPVSGSDGCWRNSVHADAIGSQTGSKVDREGADSCFRGRVRFAAQSGKGVDGADVDDRRSLRAASQVRNSRPAASDDTEKVELDHPNPYLIGRLLECAVMRIATGHVDHDVNSAEPGGCGSEGLLDRGHIGDIEPDSHMVAVRVRNRRSHLLACGLIKICHRHLSAFLGQPGGTSPADAVPSTDHYACSAGEASEPLFLHEWSLPRAPELRDLGPASAPAACCLTYAVRVQVLIVDGANVVGSRPDGWWRDRAGAARRLHEQLSTAVLPYDEIVLVLEGDARRGNPTGADGRVRTLHALGSGDDAIVDAVRAQAELADGRGITVVTADRGLRDRVEAAGAKTVSPSWLLDQL